MATNKKTVGENIDRLMTEIVKAEKAVYNAVSDLQALRKALQKQMEYVYNAAGRASPDASDRYDERGVYIEDTGR